MCNGPSPLEQAQARILELESENVEYDRVNSLLMQEAGKLRQEISILHAVLAPILRHATGPDNQPPLRFSVEETRRIREVVDVGGRETGRHLKEANGTLKTK